MLCTFLLVRVCEREGQFTPQGHPFAAEELKVGEEEQERGGSEEGGVLSVKLGFAKRGRLVGRGLSERVASNWWRRV